MKVFKINLIGSLPFFVKNKKTINFDFGHIFWNIFFDLDFLKSYFSYINLSISNKFFDDFKTVLKNIPKSYLILKKSQKQYTSNEELFFVYKNINILLEYINSNDFKLSFHLDTYISENLEFSNKNIFRFFYEKYLDFDFDTDENILFFDVKNSNELYQIGIILDILKEKNIDFKTLKIYISLINLSEFDNKIILKEKIKELPYFENIDSIFISDFGEDYLFFLEKYNIDNCFKKELNTKEIFGKKYVSLDFFNKGCSWRKCAFCNIGKFYKPSRYTISEKIQITKNNLKTIIDNNIDCIDIFDPSISLDDMLLISHEIIKSGVNVKIHVRMTIDEDFSEEKCKILKNAGVAYLGLGLEHTSVRLNKQFNKYNSYDNFLEKISSNINNCINSGIGVHLYTILGFPGETQEELSDLRDYLLSFKNDLLTYTPGRFGLNRGTYVYNNSSMFGIEDIKDNIYSQWIDYYCKTDNQSIVTDVQNLLNNNFLFCNTDNLESANGFFCFLESSSIFHIQKMYIEEFK